MEEHPKVSVIVVTHNRREDLREAIESLRQQTYDNMDIIVVDNASSDGTHQMLKEGFDDLKVITLPRNTGPYGGRNAGIADSRGEILFFLDDDTTLERESISRIVERFSTEATLGLIACKIVLVGSDEPDPRLYHQVASDFDGEFYLGDMVGEGAVAIRRDVLDKVGLWPAHYFRAQVGRYLSYRILDAGYNMLYLPRARVYDKLSPLGSISRRQIEREKMFYVVRNQLWIAWKYLPLPRAAAESVIKVCYHFWESLGKGALLPYLRGLGAALITMPRILVKERSPVSRRTLEKIDYLSYGEMVTDPAMLESFSPLSFRSLLWRKFTALMARGRDARSGEETR